MNEANKNNLEYFDNIYKNCQIDKSNNDRWLDVFSDIIDEARGPVIDLGCGSGHDIPYLLSKNKSIYACDGSATAVSMIEKEYPNLTAVTCFDMLEPFPYYNKMTDLIIADLCLHYFTREDTERILKEIRRILIDRGHLLVRVNSINGAEDEIKGCTEVEPHLYMTSDGRYKRYFDSGDVYDMFNSFYITYVRDERIERYGKPKEVYTLKLKNRK